MRLKKHPVAVHQLNFLQISDGTFLNEQMITVKGIVSWEMNLTVVREKSQDFHGERQGFHTVQTNCLMVFQKSLGDCNSQQLVNQCLRIFDKEKSPFSLLGPLHCSFPESFLWKRCRPFSISWKAASLFRLKFWESELSANSGMAKKERTGRNPCPGQRLVMEGREGDALGPACRGTPMGGEGQRVAMLARLSNIQ